MPARALGRFYFRYQGRLTATATSRAAAGAGLTGRGPIGASFTEWARRGSTPRPRGGRGGQRGRTLPPPPRRALGAFVFERLKRVFGMPPTVAYRQGGWGLLMDDLGAYARTLGVRHRDRLTDRGAARRHHDRGHQPAGGPSTAAGRLADAGRPDRSGLLDLGLRESRRDAFVVSDLDGGGWLETFSIPDPSIAPKGCSVTQLQLPLLDGEARADTIARLEDLADRGLPGWRDRLEFRRDSVARGRSGAVDYPGTSWRDRPAIDRGSGVYLVGDQVAAPGLLSEVSVSSGLQAGRLAAASESAARHLPRSLPLAAEQG